VEKSERRIFLVHPLTSSKEMISKFQRFWSGEKGLPLLLVILSVHIFIIMPFGEITVLGKTLGFVFYIFLLSAGLKYLTNNKKFTTIVLIAFVSVVFFSTRMFSDRPWISVLTTIFIILYFALLAWIVLAKTFSQGPITISRIQGSIVGYLLIGLIFANLFHLVFHLAGPSSFNALRETDLKAFLYFSLTTLTTVGYGDITPAIPASRSLANLESLIGQLYPAILIARLVSMEFIQRK
jgi:Ion channel